LDWNNTEANASALLILGKNLNRKDILDSLKSTEFVAKGILGKLKDRVKHELNT